MEYEEYTGYEEAHYWHSISDLTEIVDEYGLHKVLADLMPGLGGYWLPDNMLQCRSLYENLNELQNRVVNRMFIISESDNNGT